MSQEHMAGAARIPGVAKKATVVLGEWTKSYDGLYISFDGNAQPVYHLFDPSSDPMRHVATVPISATVIQWD